MPIKQNDDRENGMKEKLKEVFEGLVSQDILDCMVTKFDEIANVNIMQLGVDSLAVMKIVFRLEDILDIEVDYEEFKIQWIETPQLVLDILERGNI